MVSQTNFAQLSNPQERRKRRRSLVPLLALPLVLSIPITSGSAQENWPQFRGPDGQGHADKAPLQWSESKNVRWKTPVPGRGWSSPVVFGDRVWVTTAIETPDTWSSEATAIVKPSSKKSEGVEKVDLRLVGLDRKTGRIVENVAVFEQESPKPIHALNSYASPTPAISDGRLFCTFGEHGLAGINLITGEVIWQEQFPLEQSVGAGSSLVVYEPGEEENAGRATLLVVCDAMEEQYMLGLDPATGDTLWRTDRPPIVASSGEAQKSFCTPVLVNHQGRVEAIVPTAHWLTSYDPSTGQELWRFRHGEGFSIVPRPVVGQGIVYFSTGYHPPTMIALNIPSTSGRSEQDGPLVVTDEDIAWDDRRNAPTQPSPVLVGDHLITVSDAGFASSHEAVSGKLSWRRRMGGAYSASPIAVGDLIYLFDRSGESTVLDVSLTDKPQEVASNHLDGDLMATPAVADGELFIRTTEGVYCINGAE